MKMSDSKTILSACTFELRNIAAHYKHNLRYHIQTKGEVIDSFRRDAYVIILIAEKFCNEDELNMYRKLYNELKKELLDYMTYLEM